MELEKVDTLEEDLTRILEYQEKGYLFHGSRMNNIERLEPQRSYDVDSTNTFNNDTAVFASSNPQTCIFAMLDREKMPKEMQKGTVIVGNRGNSLLAEIPLRWKEYMEDNVGTLYVIPPDGFITQEDGSWQYKNREAVVPVDKISVSFEHFLRLGGKVIWTEE
ncbi:MAG: hypothetical protein ACOX06_02425 [Candidatus Dojkabacteria bacterium]|jgi:hypothetical protein